MSLGPGMRTPEARPLRQAATLVVLALASALLSNALAGPARRLAWRPAPLPPAHPLPPAPAVPVPSAPAPALLPTPSQAPAGTPVRPVAPTPPPKAAQAAPVPAPASLRDAFPPPADGAPFEIEDGEALALHRAGAVFLDARRTQLYLMGHIAGARVISPWEDGVEAQVQAFADATFDPKDPVVIYCSGGDCRDSHLLADRLWSAGFRNLRIFRGGWPAWLALKGPTAQGREARP